MDFECGSLRGSFELSAVYRGLGIVRRWLILIELLVY